MKRSLVVGADETDESQNALARAAELARAAAWDSWWSTSGTFRSSPGCPR